MIRIQLPLLLATRRTRIGCGRRTRLWFATTTTSESSIIRRGLSSTTTTTKTSTKVKSNSKQQYHHPQNTTTTTATKDTNPPQPAFLPHHHHPRNQQHLQHLQQQQQQQHSTISSFFTPGFQPTDFTPQGVYLGSTFLTTAPKPLPIIDLSCLLLTNDTNATITTTNDSDDSNNNNNNWHRTQWLQSYYYVLTVMRRKIVEFKGDVRKMFVVNGHAIPSQLLHHLMDTMAHTWLNDSKLNAVEISLENIYGTMSFDRFAIQTYNYGSTSPRYVVTDMPVQWHSDMELLVTCMNRLTRQLATVMMIPSNSKEEEDIRQTMIMYNGQQTLVPTSSSTSSSSALLPPPPPQVKEWTLTCKEGNIIPESLLPPRRSPNDNHHHHYNKDVLLPIVVEWIPGQQGTIHVRIQKEIVTQQGSSFYVSMQYSAVFDMTSHPPEEPYWL